MQAPGPSRATAGPGNHYRVALSQVHNLIPNAPRLRRRKRREGRNVGGCPLISRLGVCGSVVNSPSGVRGGAPRPKIDFMHIWGQKEASFRGSDLDIKLVDIVLLLQKMRWRRGFCTNLYLLFTLKITYHLLAPLTYAFYHQDRHHYYRLYHLLYLLIHN